MTDADWDAVHRVHLRGSYKTAKAAWPFFLKQKYGRIINTASSVGLYGNFGQANYASAKAGLIAFSNSLSLEGRRSNIFANTIAPNAGTAMTATVWPAEMVEMLKPDYVAPLVAYLCHDSSQETGSIFECGSCWVAKVRWQRSGGVGFPVNKPLLPEHVASRWADITNFKDGRATNPTSTQESFEAIHANFENVDQSKSASSSEPTTKKSGVDVEGAKKAKFPSATFEYNEKDVILYALGVGAKRTDLPYVYENSEQFKPLPTFGVVPAFDYQMKYLSFGDFLPEFNPMMLVHGEQYLEIKKPIPSVGKMTSTGRIIDILDKGKGILGIVGVTTRDSSGDIVTENEFSFFIRGSGGYGGKKESDDRGAATASNEPPNRPADKIVREKVSEDQAALVIIIVMIFYYYLVSIIWRLESFTY
jgi:multifunctional beta-oxidation protein